MKFIAIMFLFCISLNAQNWANVLSSSRAPQETSGGGWGNAGVRGGIPTNRTQCVTTQCNTVVANAGSSTNAQVNAAIQSAPAGTFVFLPAGTYNIGAGGGPGCGNGNGIQFCGHSNVTLRGAGANQTFLIFTNDSNCHGFFAVICIDSSDTSWVGGPSHTANWTAGYTKDSTAITLDSFSGLHVSQQLLLDQADDSSDPGTLPYHCQAAGSNCSLEGNNNNGYRSNRDQGQSVQVVSCGTSTPGASCTSGNITISPGLYTDTWSSSKSPGAWWATTPITGVGIENISWDVSNDSGPRGVEIFNCMDCWVSGVRSIKTNKSHVEILQSARVTVRDSYFYLTQDTQSQSYGVSPTGSSDVLVENNIFQYIATPLQMNGCMSCVIAYNYAINNYYTTNAGYVAPAYMCHTAGTELILLEGNTGSQVYCDVFHGSHNFMAFFRNYILGNQPACYNGTPFSFSPCTSHQTTLIFQSWTRETNVVGNVLGQTGVSVAYENGTNSVFDLGSGNTEGAVTVTTDARVSTTLMRWGNCDAVSGFSSCRFVSGEVPSGLAQYANSVPANNNLPSSFYRTSKPSFFAVSKPWPLLGPDVTGGNIGSVGGHVYTSPAQDCANLMGIPANGTGSVQTFNPAICYPTNTIQPPSSPATGLFAKLGGK